MESDDSENEGLSEVELLKIAREEAHRTVDNQINTLDGIDEKAAKILRVNLVLIGVVLTGVSVTATNQGLGEAVGSLQALLNWYFVAGVAAIIASTSLAAFTYTATTKRAGMSGRDIDNLLSNEYTPKQNLEGIVESYSTWMEYNFKTNTKTAPLGTGILVLLIYGLVLLSVGVYHGVIGQIGIAGNILIVAVLGLFTAFSDIISQLKRYWKYKDFDPTED